MAGKLASGGKGKGLAINSDPNVIPFIDIMLVMLIIFMVAAPPPTVDIKVDLPPPGPQIVIQSVDKPTTVVLYDRGGQLIFIDGVQVNQSNFESELMRIVAQNNPTKQGDLRGLFVDAKVFVDADQNTAYENVINLINEIDQTGFKKVSLLVKSAAG